MESLRPVEKSAQRWTWLTIALLWLEMNVNVGGITFSAIPVNLGLSFWESIGVTFVSSVILVIGMSLQSAPGVAYGIPFPIYARLAFGWHGALWAVLVSMSAFCNEGTRQYSIQCPLHLFFAFVLWHVNRLVKGSSYVETCVLKKIGV